MQKQSTPQLTSYYRFSFSFWPKSENAVFKYRLVAPLDISDFGLLAEWDWRLIGYVRLAVLHLTGRIVARGFLQTVRFCGKLAIASFRTLDLAKFKTELWICRRPSDVVAPKNFILSTHFRMTFRISWHVTFHWFKRGVRFSTQISGIFLGLPQENPQKWWDLPQKSGMIP